MTIANRLRAEGEARGFVKGKSVGEARGLVKGKSVGAAKLLSGQLGDRFGSLPADVRQRISTADEKQLNVWGRRVLVASTLKDVFVVS